MDRATRRAHTARVIRRRLSEAETWGFYTQEVPHKYAKTHVLGCNCRRKRHGNPKVSMGMCYGDAPRTDVLRWRALNRELTRLSRAWDLESDEVVLATTKKTREW